MNPSNIVDYRNMFIIPICLFIYIADSHICDNPNNYQIRNKI